MMDDGVIANLAKFDYALSIHHNDVVLGLGNLITPFGISCYFDKLIISSRFDDGCWEFVRFGRFNLIPDFDIKIVL